MDLCSNNRLDLYKLWAIIICAVEDTVLANTEPLYSQEVYLLSFNQNLGPVLRGYRVEGSENTVVSVHIALIFAGLA